MCSGGPRTDIASTATALLAFVARQPVQLERLAPDREGVVGAAGDRRQSGGILAEHRLDVGSAS